jgi:hypothetical protein
MAWKGAPWSKRPLNIKFDDQPVVDQFKMHWTSRPQPDLGGALNFSFDSRQEPIREILGTAICVWNPWKPIPNTPLIPLLMRPAGGLGVFTGTIVHQPLTDPTGLGAGGMTGNPPNLTQGLYVLGDGTNA